MDGVTDTVEEELEDEELWDAKDLKIPVYNTKDGISHSLFNLGTYRLNFISIGSDMCELKSSVTRSLLSNFYFAYSLAQGHKLPRDGHSCHRLRFE